MGPMTVRIKICGVTTLDDAKMCVDKGADALGINFWKGSPRCCDLNVATQIGEALGQTVLLVGVFVNEEEKRIRYLQERCQLRCVQLHGDESPEFLERFLPHAYKAVPIQGPETVNEVDRFGGQFILVDAYFKGMRGGSGVTTDWSIAAEIGKKRDLVLAGGLNSENVRAAVAQVRPWCVDVASGVESNLGRKDASKVERFIRAVNA